MNLSFLIDPDVWIAATAVVALIVSLWPKLRSLVSSPHINITLPGQGNFLLHHYLGNLNLTVFVDLHNDGATTVDISKLDCFIVKATPGGRDSATKQWHVPAQTMFLKQPPSQQGQDWPELLLGVISVKPGEHCQEFVRCFAPFSDDEEEESQGIRASVGKSISDKLIESQRQGLSQAFVEADPEVIGKARSFFDKTFDLTRGEYRLYIAALSDAGKILGVKGFKFILYENAVQELRKVIDDYKYGWGLVYPHPGTTIMSVQPRLVPISEEKQVENDYQTARKR